MKIAPAKEILQILNIFNSSLFLAFRYSDWAYTIYDYVKLKKVNSERYSHNTEKDSRSEAYSESVSKAGEEKVTQSNCFLLIDIRTNVDKKIYMNKIYRNILQDISLYKNFRIVLKTNFIQEKNLMGNINNLDQQ